MTQLERPARSAALAAAVLCVLAGALGCWPSVSEAAKSAEQGPQPAQSPKDDEASQKAAAAAAARKAYDAGLKDFANSRLQGAVDQLSAAVKAGGLSPPEMAKALYTRGLAYKKLNRPGLAISDLTSALWLKNGLSGNDRDAATRERSEAYRMAGLADSGSVPDRPAVAPANSGPNTDSAGLSAKAIAEAATSAGKSAGQGSPQPVTRQDATSEAAQDAARARAAYAANDTSLHSLASSSPGTSEASAPVVQSATVGPSAWAATSQPAPAPGPTFKTYAPVPASEAPPVKVTGTFTLLNPAPHTSTKAVAAPSVVAMNEAKTSPPPPAPTPVVWAQPTVQPAPAAPAVAPAAPQVTKLAAVEVHPSPPSSTTWAPPTVHSSPAPVSTWTPPPSPAPAAVAPSASAAGATAPKPVTPQPLPATASTWTPPPQTIPSAVAPNPPPAADPVPEENKPEVSVPMTTAGYVSSLFASDLPTPPPPRRVSFSSEDAMDSEPSAGSSAKTADKKSKSGVKSIMVAENKTAPVGKNTNYKVHIAALRSRAEAEALAQKLVSEHASDLANHVPTVDETVIGSMGTFYRVRISGYSSQDEPRGLCSKLRTSGLDCLVVTN